LPTFCRHNRFLADCPICAKGTVLDPERQAQRRPRPASAGRSSGAGKRRTGAAAASVTKASRGPFAAVGPYDGAEIRLERVPGGLRLAAWRGGQIDRVAPVVVAADVPRLLESAADSEVLAASPLPPPADAAAEPGASGASPGRTGELRDELRVERLDDDRVRIARWIMRPNRGWELQEAPVMLPPKRFTQALESAARRGVLRSGSPADERL
jgi:hypothetical protein